MKRRPLEVTGDEQGRSLPRSRRSFRRFSRDQRDGRDTRQRAERGPLPQDPGCDTLLTTASHTGPLATNDGHGPQL